MSERKGRIVVEVDSEIFREIVQHVEQQFIPGECSICYEGQIPPVAFMLIEGIVSLRKRQKEHDKLVPGEIFGIVEHYHRTISRYEAQIEPGAKIAVMDRAAIQSIIKQKNLQSSHLFQSILHKK